MYHYQRVRLEEASKWQRPSFDPVRDGWEGAPEPRERMVSESSEGGRADSRNVAKERK